MRIRKREDFVNDEDARLIAACSDALAHPIRVAMFRFIYTENIKRKDVCNKDLVEEFGYAQATVSQHVSKLSLSGLIDVYKKGASSYYYVNLGMLGKYLDTVKKLNKV